jgi:hypothetical protein
MVVNGPHGLTAAPVKRPDPPRHLGAAEAVEWREIVGSMPHGSFPRRLYVTLELLCRHTVTANHVSMLLAQCVKQKKFDLREYVTLLNARLEESEMIIRLLRAMRLTHQTLIRADSAKLRPRSPGPWSNGRSNSPWETIYENDRCPLTLITLEQAAKGR